MKPLTQAEHSHHLKTKAVFTSRGTAWLSFESCERKPEPETDSLTSAAAFFKRLCSLSADGHRSPLSVSAATRGRGYGNAPHTLPR